MNLGVALIPEDLLFNFSNQPLIVFIKQREFINGMRVEKTLLQSPQNEGGAAAGRLII